MRNKQFDLLRLLAASLVIVSHSYDLLGKHDAEPLNRLTNGRFIFSDLGIYSFFILSGLLVDQSFQKSVTLLDFWRKRVLRIFPALWVVVLVACFLIGPICSRVSLQQYFTHRDTYLYLLNGSLLQMHYDLPGVFISNPFSYVNGSLWTLQYELLMYAVVALQVFLPNSRKQKQMVIFILIICLGLWLSPTFKKIPLIRISTDYIGLFGSLFVIGMVINKWNLASVIIKIPWIVVIMLFSFTLFLLPKEVFCFISLPVFLIKFSAMKEGPINVVTKAGDVSYGLYLYGFLAQQIIINYVSVNVTVLLPMSLAIAWLFGFVSWRSIEKPALKRKLLVTVPKIISNQETVLLNNNDGVSN